MAQNIVERDDAAHGVAEDDDGQAGVLARDQVMNAIDVGNHLCASVRLTEDPLLRVRRLRVAVAAVIVGVGMEPVRGKRVGETAVAGGMFGKPVVDLDDATGVRVSAARVEIERGARRRRVRPLVVKWHEVLPCSGLLVPARSDVKG